MEVKIYHYSKFLDKNRELEQEKYKRQEVVCISLSKRVNK